MVCETRRQPDETPQQRRAKIDAALRRLEQQLSAGTVTVALGPTGAAALVGWKDRDDVTDVCAIRALTQQRSWAMRQAIERAQTTSGRKFNLAAVAGGLHSHDGGKTWHPGH